MPEYRRVSVEHSDSIFSLGYRNYEQRIDERGRPWASYSNRYLALNDVPTWDLGFPCESCTMLFERIAPGTTAMSPHDVSERLNSGVDDLDDEIVQALARLVPVGEYAVSLLTFHPKIVLPGSADDYFAQEYERTSARKHDPNTEYFRGRTEVLPHDAGLGRHALYVELAVPLYPISMCVSGVVSEWETKLANDAKPTVLAVSIPQWVRGADYDISGEPDMHVVLTHFILDGHHKMLVAARSQREVSVIAFVNLNDRPGETIGEETTARLLNVAAGPAIDSRS